MGRSQSQTRWEDIVCEWSRDSSVGSKKKMHYTYGVLRAQRVGRSDFGGCGKVYTRPYTRLYVLATVLGSSVDSTVLSTFPLRIAWPPVNVICEVLRGTHVNVMAALCWRAVPLGADENGGAAAAAAAAGEAHTKQPHIPPGNGTEPSRHAGANSEPHAKEHHSTPRVLR